MRKFGFVVVLIVVFAVVFFTAGSIAAQRGEGQRGGQRGNEPPRPPMDSKPKMFDTAEYKIRCGDGYRRTEVPVFFLIPARRKHTRQRT